MNVPGNTVCSRIELLIALPVDWQIDRLDELDWGWPFSVLKFLAHYPAAWHTWLDYGHVEQILTLKIGNLFAKICHSVTGHLKMHHQWAPQNAPPCVVDNLPFCL